MAYWRATIICLSLIASFAVAAPLQWAARRRGWTLRFWLPVFVSRALMRLLRVEVHAQGAASGGGGPLLLAANHVSWIDILAVSSVAPVCFLAKKEVRGWPVISAFARVQETVFVDRTQRRSIPGANAAIASRMLAGRPALLFPEGTTGDGLALRRFHSSHFAAARDLLAEAQEVEAVRVQPLAIRYSSPAAAWYGDATLLPHLWSLLKGKPLRCDLVFGAPLAYGRGTDRRALTRQVEASVAAMLAELGPAGEATPQPAAEELEALAARA
ncbi:lysophospholipid acyltransferase family protein [Methylocapsa acidiphila]|uniref:lysophospholipid acyltransferase family protein n=1 Tax=Methylocapsa acidiphila TaxID=133552 RepID=UPI00040A406F|nr:lysophospholipid acyltransferase family protein [Methylocapsa acidiphila]